MLLTNSCDHTEDILMSHIPSSGLFKNVGALWGLTPNNAQVLPLALHSEITLSGAQGFI